MTLCCSQDAVYIKICLAHVQQTKELVVNYNASRVDVTEKKREVRKCGFFTHNPTDVLHIIIIQ